MLNIGFSEILVVSVIGLIIIGPQRLPQTARFLGHFIGRMQRQIAGVKADIKREMDLEDMKNIHRDYEKTAEDMRHVFDQAAAPMRQAAEEAKTIVDSASADVKTAADENSEKSENSDNGEKSENSEKSDNDGNSEKSDNGETDAASPPPAADKL